MLRAAISNAARRVLHAFAFAPGALKTALRAWTVGPGMLFVPAPARPTHELVEGIERMSCRAR